MRLFATLLAGFLVAVPLVAQDTAEPLKATGSIRIKDAAGDMGPFRLPPDGEVPPLDVVLLEVVSDGTRLSFSATLKDPPGQYASPVVEVQIDADNNPATGSKGVLSDEPEGFEYEAELLVCMTYDNRAQSCGGMFFKDAKATRRYAAVGLDRYQTKDGEQTFVDVIGGRSPRDVTEVPITGSVVTASVDYVDIGVKSGQTIRLYARERGGSPLERRGAFPIVLLKLK